MQKIKFSYVILIATKQVPYAATYSSRYMSYRSSSYKTYATVTSMTYAKSLHLGATTEGLPL